VFKNRMLQENVTVQVSALISQEKCRNSSVDDGGMPLKTERTV
jgi:hypothetical protein